ncbi:MAG: CinA family protein [Thauera sp.]|nr:CinA family protein [Thauera sp.]
MDNLTATARYMTGHDLMLVTAESCTAGLIASHLADVPGAGHLLDCAFVVYSEAAKRNCLGVRSETIEAHGLTSEAVAREMALGALRRSRANLAVANTGVADDGGDGTPPGTQCYAWAFSGDGQSGTATVFTETRRFDGDRSAVREASARWALERIADHHARLATAPDGQS